MIRLHHLNNSRSQRILWLLEELGLDYEIIHHRRDPVTQRSPESLRAVHPLAKAPVIEDGDLVLAESGAIVDYLVTRYGAGRLAPGHDDERFPRYLYWLHFAEGSAMFPLILDLLLEITGAGELPLAGHVKNELDGLLAHLDDSLAQSDFFTGDEFSAADLMMAFVVEFADGRGLLEGRLHLPRYLARVRARPAHQRALERTLPE